MRRLWSACKSEKLKMRENGSGRKAGALQIRTFILQIQGIASQQPDLADRRSAGFFVTRIVLPRATVARNLRWIPAVDWRNSQPACGSVAVKEERKPVLSAAADFFSWSGTQPAVGVSCRNTLSLPRQFKNDGGYGFLTKE